jgi:hypothetical protein
MRTPLGFRAVGLGLHIFRCREAFVPRMQLVELMHLAELVQLIHCSLVHRSSSAPRQSP